MRKDSIVRDFKTSPIPGTFQMQEITNMMCGKMMDIEDTIRVGYTYKIKDINLSDPLYIQLAKINYDTLKKDNIISLKIDQSQSKIEKETNTKWIFEINTKNILREYLYNEIFTLNPQSAFNSIPNNVIPNGNINKIVFDYIDYNVLDKYKVKDILLWTDYYELKNDILPGSGSNILNPTVKLLYQQPVFSLHAIPENNADLNKQSIFLKPYSDGIYEVSYKQTKSAQYYVFSYYYDIIFEKI